MDLSFSFDIDNMIDIINNHDSHLGFVMSFYRKYIKIASGSGSTAETNNLPCLCAICTGVSFH